MPKCDFSGWATKNDLRCSDGRVIRRDAFKDDDGQYRPLVWNHSYNSPENVLGHALLENRDNGVYAYCTFNDTESGQNAKTLVEHGDVCALSIHASGLTQHGNDVLHGDIKEVSLVLAGANPGAFIDTVIKHGEEMGDEGIIYTGEPISLGDDPMSLSHASKKDEEDKKDTSDDEETIADVLDTLTDKQRDAVNYIIGSLVDDNGSNEEDTDKEDEEEKEEDSDSEKSDAGNDSEEEEDEDEKKKKGDKNMKHNLFDKEDETMKDSLTHSDQASIIELAKSSSVGNLQDAISVYMKENSNSFTHGIDDIETLFPEYKDVYPGAPELISRDQGWVSVVMKDAKKSPISRIRTRQADIRDETDIRGYGYEKGNQKNLMGNVKLLRRTTDPQTVYVKDELNRDDIIDITDFDVVEWQYGIMRQTLEEELALAVMIGDGREEGDANKIYDEHIRAIWTDDDLYCIHADVDIEAAREELQGTETDAHFGENYIYAEAIITAALYAREKFKGSGTPDFFCTPHLLNVMLLARDLNGRRIYDSKSDLAAALNVSNIYTAEQFEGKTRVDEESGDTKKLLGIFVNLTDYQIGSTKGGEITKFNQFNIDFNKEQYLIETRLSGALTRVYSAIALEEPESSDDDSTSGGGYNP